MPGPEPEVSDDEILFYFGISDTPVLTVKMLQEDVDQTRQNLNDKLWRLADEGYLETMKVGASARVWWLTDEGKRRVREHYSDGDASNGAE